MLLLLLLLLIEVSYAGAGAITITVAVAVATESKCIAAQLLRYRRRHSSRYYNYFRQCHRHRQSCHCYELYHYYFCLDHFQRHRHELLL